MGKGVKRTISIILTACILCAVVCTQLGFSCKKKYELFDVGDFKIIKDNYSINHGYYIVYGLSEQGEKAENLFIPMELDGKQLSYGGGIANPKPSYKNTFNNSKLKKLFLNDTKDFFEKYDKQKSFVHDFRTGFLVLFTKSAINKSDFNKIILNGFFYNMADLSWFVDEEFYKLEYDKYDIGKRYTNKIYKYVNSKFFTTVLNGTIKNGEDAVYYETIDFNRTLVYHLDTVAEMESALDYLSGFYWRNNDFYYFIKTYRLANVQFMYNYDNSPTHGYYWIDDIENGERIDVIPEEPTREGYTFGGWYTEPECANIFDFNTPISKQEVDWAKITYLEEELPDDYVTFLYAKWIEN